MLLQNYTKRFKHATTRQQIFMAIGIVGSLVALTIYLSKPSYPNPDKLFIFAVLIGMIFQQALQVIKRLGPFVALLIAYDSFRGIVPHLNHRVNYTFMPRFDEAIFGSLPTHTLQNWLWAGHASWYDFVFYVPYLMHFFLPFTLAIIVWKTREQQYWRYITAFVSISFFAFFVFLLFPAAPPWLASDQHVIEPITRVSSSVWASLGINDFPTLYNKLAANPVAAVPSLHAAYATLFAFFVINFYSFRWRFIVVIYPLLIYTGTIYQGEHYFFDELVGAILGAAGYYTSPWLSKKLVRSAHAFHLAVHRLVRKTATR